MNSTNTAPAAASIITSTAAVTGTTLQPRTVTPTETYVGDQSAAVRMAVLAKLNAQAGYSAPDTLFPEGEALYDIGEENLRKVREETDRLPTLRDFASTFLAAEKARALVDVKEKVGNMRMDPQTGKLYRIRPDGSRGGLICYTHTGLSQLVSMHAEALSIPRNFVGSLAFLTPRVRAEAFNDMAVRASGFFQKNAKDVEERMFRTAVNLKTGERYLRAVTSTMHVLHRGGYAALVTSLANIYPDAKVSAAHCEDRMDLELVFPMMNREIRVGDVLMGALGVTISETKDTSARVWDALLRVLCKNLGRAWYGEDNEWTRRHVGPEQFLIDIAGRLSGGMHRLNPFIEAFGDAYSKPLPGSKTRVEVVERVEKKFPEVKKLLPATNVLGAWDMDGSRSAGNTLAGLVNAYTRAAQQLTPSGAETIEALAGQLTVEGWAAIGM